MKIIARRNSLIRPVTRLEEPDSARRQLLIGGFSLVAGSLVAGCGFDPATNDDLSDEFSDSGSDLDIAAGPDPDADDFLDVNGEEPLECNVAQTSRCSGATVPEMEGPFYLQGQPERSRLYLQRHRLTVYGTVRGLNGSTCDLLPDARVEIWHSTTGQNGFDSRYVDDAYRGWVRAKGGCYAFYTILPGRYLNGRQYRPRHVHFKVSHPGFRTLTTQLYFKGDRYIQGDFSSRTPSLQKELRLENGVYTCAFNVVLAR